MLGVGWGGLTLAHGAVVNKNGSLFCRFPGHKYIFWLLKEMLKIHVFAAEIEFLQ